MSAHYLKAAIAITFVLYLVAIGMWIVIPDEVIINTIVSATTVFITTIIAFYWQRQYKHFYSSRYFTNLSYHVIGVFIIICILSLLNFLAYKNPIAWDITPNSTARLTEQSRKVAKSINTPTKFIVFANRDSFLAIKELLELYRLENGLITIQLIDAQNNPGKISKYRITKIPQLVVETPKKKDHILEFSELAITSALVKITSLHDPTIVYIRGHGELDLNDTSPQGASKLKDKLQQAGLILQDLDLRLNQEIPKDTTVAIIWGPRYGFSDKEIGTIDKYLKQGGSLIVAIGPSFQGNPLSNLRQLISKFGLQVPNSIVIDSLSSVSNSNGTIPIAKKYHDTHPIMKGIDKNAPIFFPLANAVVTTRPNNGHLLAYTSPFPAAWGDTDPKSLHSGKVTYDAKRDLKGPIGLVGAVENRDDKYNLLVFGNATFVQNMYAKYFHNFDLLISAIGHYAYIDSTITLNKLPTISERPIFINHHHTGLVFYIMMLAMPLSLVAIAIYKYRSILHS